MDVEVVSSEMVVPLNPSPHPSSLWTSNLDLVILNAYIKTVYFFDKPPSPASDHDHDHDHHQEISRLKHALGTALSHFWPMAGRLSHDPSGRLQIDCNDAGVLFVEARCSFEMNALPGGFTPNPNLLDLVPTLDSTADLAAQPLVVIQVTKFKCGGISVGTGIEHHVADGKSAVKFLNTWADISRGVAFNDKVYFDRKCLQARTPPTPEFAHEEYLSLPLPPNYNAEKVGAASPYTPSSMGKRKHSLNAFDDSSTGHDVSNGHKSKGELPTTNGSSTHNHVANGLQHEPPLDADHDNDNDHAINSSSNGSEEEEDEESNGHHSNNNVVNGGKVSAAKAKADESIVEMFEIPKELVQKLKQMQEEHLAAGTADTKPYTSYELLAAHLWRSVCEARKLGEGVKSKMIVAVDGRSRMRGLPEGYFGNVIFTSVMAADSGEVVKEDIVVAASRVRQALRKLDDPYCRSALDFLEEVPDTTRFIKGAHTFASPNVGFTSWTQLPIYECDFGWGQPIHAGPAHIGFEGLAYVMRSPLASNAGGFRLIISLQRQHMASFAKIFLCMSN